MLSPDLQRLAHIRDYCAEIEKTVARYGASFDAFARDADYQRSVSFCIMQIGELSGKLAPEFRRASAERVPWGLVKGMRNLVAHDYASMEQDMLWETVTTDIPVLKAFCDEQLDRQRNTNR